MFKRLFVLLLLVVATVSVNTPAHASTLSITYLSCDPNGWAPGYSNALTFDCWAEVSGGTGTYTSFVWLYGGTYFTTPGPRFENKCIYSHRGKGVSVTVTDSAGATAYASTMLYCNFD